MKVTVENKKGLNKDVKVFVDKKTINNYMDEKYEEIINLMSFDKKNHLDKLKFVLLKDLGIVKNDVEISENLIKESFDFYLS